MLHHRLHGSAAVLQAVLLLGNLALLLSCYALERHFAFFGLSDQVNLLIYLATIPIAFLWLRQSIARTMVEFRDRRLLRTLTVTAEFNLAIAIGFAIVYSVFKDVAVSRLFLLSYLLTSCAFNFLVLFFGPTLLSRILFGSTKSTAVLVCLNTLPDPIRAYIRNAALLGVECVGYYANQSLHLHKMEWLGTTNDFLKVEGGRKKLRCELVIATAQHTHDPRLRNIADAATRVGARLQIFSDLADFFDRPIRFFREGQLDFITFDAEPLQNPLNAFLKRCVDIAVSLPVVCLIFPPLCLAVWLAHRLQSPGPLFFKQTRYGINRRPFTILKFRSMHVHDKALEARQASRGDPRIFPFGAFLRRSSLDEFPQFWNVLRGQMSVVGPRPHLTLHDQQFEKGFHLYRSRHFVKPGITGLAQVSGLRGEATSMDLIVRRVQADREYIIHWSLFLEFSIILRTALQVFFPPKSAY